MNSLGEDMCDPEKKVIPPEWLTTLVLQFYCDGWWSLAAPLIFISKILGRIEVPAGFLTDGPSIPRIPGLYEKFRERAWLIAIIHDWLYSLLCPIQCTREQADEVFHEGMDLLYPGWLDRIKNDEEYAGVRLGGASHFRGGKEEEGENAVIKINLDSLPGEGP
jgi:hypothetical protein